MGWRTGKAAHAVRSGLGAVRAITEAVVAFRFSGRGASSSILIAMALVLCSAAQIRAGELVGATAGELGVSPSGSASYSIPIAVPAGTTGLQPKITLQYDSMAGNGPAGMGWSIGGLSVISRCPTSYNLDGTAAGSPGLDPVDYDANDKYCLNGQRLVPVSGTYGANGTEYRTTQDEFSRIVSYGTAGLGPQWFKVWRKGGEIMEFGNTADSRIEALGRSDVFVWAINRLSDTAGNYETFTYTEDTTNGGYRIARIDYTGNAAQGLSPYNRVEFIYTTRPDPFRSYHAGSKITQDQRLTNIKVYADASLYRDYQIAYETTLPLSGRSRPISVTECATNTTTSSLDCFPPTTFQWSPDGQASLTTVSLAGAPGISGSTDDHYNVLGSGDFNGDGLSDLYLVQSEPGGFASGSSSYSDRVWLADGSGGFQKITVSAALRVPANYTVGASGDFNGDGLTDLYLYRSDGYGRKEDDTTPPSRSDLVSLSNGDGTFTRVTLPTTASAFDDQKVQATGDFNGDGIQDVLLIRSSDNGRMDPISGVQSNGPHVLLGNSNGSFTRVAIGVSAGINIMNYSTYAVPATGDFNGDGLTDLYVFNSDKKQRKAGTSVSDHFWISKWAPNGTSGTLTFQDVVLPAAQSMANGKGIGGAGDYNGDGLTDFYVFAMDDNGRGSGNLQDATWLSKGNLSFEVVSGLSAGSQVGNEYKIVSVGDFTGDGLTDHYVMQTASDDVNGARGSSDDYLLKSKGDGHFEKVSFNGAVGIPGPPYTMEHYQVKATGDFNGDGLADMYLYRAHPDGRSDGEASDYIFLSAWKFPDQLAGVTNGLGLSTKLAYKPLTDATVYTKGTGSAYPVQEVVAPRYVVSEVRADNGIGGENAQSYKYEALRSHVNDIGNLGFAKTKMTDAAKNITTESVYSQDWASSTEGLLLSSKTIAPAPYNVTLSEQTVSWAVASGATADGTPRKFRYSPTSTTVRKDLNGVALGTTTETTSYDDGAGNFFANYGFPRQATVTTAEPLGSVAYTKTTTNIYAHDAANWRLGRLTAASVLHQETGKPSITRTSSFTYDAGTGLITSETVEPGSALSHTKTYGYNGFGAVTSLTESWGSQNGASIKAPGGATATSRVTTYSYDARARYKTSEANPLSQSQTTNYDPVTGVVTSTTGPNNLTTNWPAQDAFGRPMRENRADGTYTTTERFRCGGGVTCPTNATLKLVTKTWGSDDVIAAPAQTVYQDKLYREVRKSTLSLNGTEVHADTIYDAQGHTAQKSEPFFQGAATIYWTTIQYDFLDRPILTTRPDTGTQSVVYNGFTETSTNELGQTKQVVKDAMGREVRVVDNLGTAVVYAYDAIGQVSSYGIDGQAGTASSFLYDARGNKISDTDPDKGTWTYTYNALGQIASQTDAKGQVTVITYDLLGRMLSRVDDATAANPGDRTSQWVYDTAPMGAGGALAKGQLASVSMPGYSASYSYDTLLRGKDVTETIEGTPYLMSTAYDAGSRPLSVTYPSGLSVQNVYNAQGYLTSVINPATLAPYWTAQADDARGNITQSLLGNGVQTIKAYDPKRGWLTSIASQNSSGTLIQNLTYSFNKLGNLTRRADGEFGANPLIETISYDNLNRLTQSSTTQSGTGAWSSNVNVVYDVLGNITSKSDTGNYTYGQAHAACEGASTPGRHAVTTVAGEKNASYCYDANGNMTSGDGRTIGYSAYDMPQSISRGATTVTFTYGPERSRYKRVDADSTGITTTFYVGGKAYEKILKPDASLETKHYIGDFVIITERTSMGSTTRSTAYVSEDHLGSIDALTDETGALIQKMSFDAWGKRREATWMAMANPYVFNALVTTRGFTGHEQIDTVGLVHMNGRVYDPELGRFISADPNVQDLSNTQSLNRYTYVLNNPLSMTDPTGFFFGSIFKAIGNFISKVFNAIASAFKAILKIPLIRAAIQIIGCGLSGPPGVALCAAVTGALTMLSGGSIGDALQAMAFTVASAGIWSGVGNFLEGFKSLGIGAFTAIKSAVHGVVGGALSMVQGGSFLEGFAANAVGAAAGVASERAFGNAGTGDTGDYFGRVTVAAIAGGSASTLTGGKFANGAVTAAFAQMWNAEYGGIGHNRPPSKLMELLGSAAKLGRAVPFVGLWLEVMLEVPPPQASVDPRKFSDYVFNPMSEKGFPKSAVFEKLGYSSKDSEFLAKMYQEQALGKYKSGQFTLGKSDNYGQRITIDINVPGVGSYAGQSSIFQSGWMVRDNGYLITLSTPFAGHP